MSSDSINLHHKVAMLVADAAAHDADVSVEDVRARRLSLGVARGDPEAIAAFYEEWFDWALAAASQATGRDESFCLDVVQEVMLRVAGKMPQMSTRIQLERWMRRVTFNTAIDALRREQRRRKRELNRPLATDSAPCDEQLEWLRHELARLDQDEQALVRVRYAGLMSVREIGASLGRSTGTVHGRLRATISRLKRRAEESDHEQ